MTVEQLREMTSEGWRTLGTMMLTEYLLVAKNATTEQIREQQDAIEKYRAVLIKQTNLAMPTEETE